MAAGRSRSGDVVRLWAEEYVIEFMKPRTRKRTDWHRTTSVGRLKAGGAQG